MLSVQFRFMAQMVKEEWKARPDLNWCPECWFNGKFESREQSEKGADDNIYSWTRFHCLNCGFSITQYTPLTLNLVSKGLSELYEGLDNEVPRHFTDEEWQEYWEKNFKAKDNEPR